MSVQGNVVQTANVLAFSAPHESYSDLVVDGQPLTLDSSGSPTWVVRDDTGLWKVRALATFARNLTKQILKTSEPYDVRDAGPLSRILWYGSPITLVVPSPSNGSGPLAYLFNAALRLAHNLLAYMNIDCNIVLDSEITADSDNHFKDTFNRGTIVFGGLNQNSFAAQRLNDANFPIQFQPGGFIIQKGTFATEGIGEGVNIDPLTRWWTQLGMSKA